MTYEFNTGTAWGKVATFTRIPRIMRDADGLYVDVEATIYDHRNFADDKERTVMLHLFRQLGRRARGTKQHAYGEISVQEIRDLSGMHPDTIKDKLAALAERCIITLDVGERGKKRLYHAAFRLPLSDWQGVKLHTPHPDDIS